MIKIKYIIHLFNDDKIIKVFQFDKLHENDFSILYKITENKIDEKKDINLEQLLIFWSFRFAKELRKNKTLEQKIYRIFENKIRTDILKGIKKISFEAIIDDLPKKIISIPIS